MKFYDENTDLMKLIEEANEGDTEAMVKCVGYFASMGEEENPLLRELRLKYIDKLVAQGNAAGLIWKADNLLEKSLCEESVQAALSCYALAAIKGEPFGMECIADMFYEGKGVTRDWGIARYMFWAAMFLCDDAKSQCPSSMTYYKVATIQEESAKDEQDMEDVIMLYKLAVLVAKVSEVVDDYAIKAQEALWRLAA